jgi:hypothetical protein
MSQVQPTEWYDQQTWRRLFSGEQVEADRARKALVNLELYPTGDLAESTFDVEEVNHRAALHQIVDELDRADLRAVFNLARLLVLTPRVPTLFDYVARRTERILALHGLALQGESVNAP